MQMKISRPKRRATNAHIFRYLQTRNPNKLEKNDLKRALEASLEECPDFWPEDSSASSSSSEQSSNGGGSKSSASSSPTSGKQLNHLRNKYKSFNGCHNHLAHSQQQQNFTTANSNFCPISTVQKRYKPVAKKNIYNEADFFHDGIMEYIEYELSRAVSNGS